MRSPLPKVRMLINTILICLIAVAVLASIAFAGRTIFMHCTSCGFSSSWKDGGGFLFELFGGYCVNCEKFVYISWKKGEKEPNPIGTIWDSSSGNRIQVYNCPTCSKPFIPFQGWLKYCPKCGKKTFEQDKSKEEFEYD
jgi:hypothetical protein